MTARDLAHTLLLAQQAMQQMRFEDARAEYTNALSAAPHSVDALRGLGFALLQLGELPGSLDALERALKVDRSDLLSLMLMGRLCLRLQQPAAARAHFAQILTRMPGSEAARSGLVDALAAQGDLAGARTQAEALLRERPEAEVAGLAAARMAFFDRDDARALELFDRLAASYPANAAHRYNRALCLLRQGRYEQAWSDYEHRFAAGAVHAALPASPRWNGEAAGHLLVVAEQGLGDTILFSRFLAQAAQRAGRLTLACPASLRALLARSLGVDCVPAPSGGAAASAACWPPHDAHVPLMSLPLLLGAGADAVRPLAPYLAPDPQRAAAWREAMPPVAAGGLKIGIVHAASVAHSTESNPFMRRTCTPASLRPLLRLPGVAAWNLGTGAAADEARWELPGLRDLPLPLESFDDTAAAVSCLDAVVSVDTAAAHVAGAVGVPLFLLLPYSRDWRWTPLEGRTPWYGDVRCYAQGYPGDWDEPVRRLAAELPKALSPTGRRRPCG